MCTMHTQLIIISFVLLTLVNGILGHDKKVVCYYGSWSTYRLGNGKCDVETIDPTVCTHLIYTFVGLNTDGTIRILDSYADLPDPVGKDGYGKFNALKKQNPSLKTLIAIGGWNEGSNKYSEVTNDPTLRSKFVNNAVEFVLKYGFDGFDLDWEYPNQREGKESDKHSFIATLKELHEAFKPHGLLLSCAVAAAEPSASQSYLISEINSYVDMINLMTYDLHGAWDNYIGMNSPLYPREDENGDARYLNVDACVSYWLNNGVDPQKLILGIPLYGRSFTLADKNNFKPGAPAQGKGISGEYTREGGFIGYNEILELDQSAWTHYWDSEGMVPYMVKDSDWIGYDNEESIILKTKYAMDRGLAGVMVWSVETDDLVGISGEKFVLLKSINHALNGESSQPTTTSSTTSPTTTSSTTSTSTTSTSTTPKPTDPTTKPPSTLPPNSGICTHEGLVRDPNDCSVFYECYIQDGEYKAARFKCGPGTLFNEETLVCDYPENVKC